MFGDWAPRHLMSPDYLTHMRTTLDLDSSVLHQLKEYQRRGNKSAPRWIKWVWPGVAS